MNYFEVRFDIEERHPHEGTAWEIMLVSSALMEEAGIEFVHIYGMVDEDWIAAIRTPFPYQTIKATLERLFHGDLEPIEELALPVPRRLSTGHLIYPMVVWGDEDHGKILAKFRRKYGDEEGKD